MTIYNQDQARELMQELRDLAFQPSKDRILAYVYAYPGSAFLINQRGEISGMIGIKGIKDYFPHLIEIKPELYLRT